MNCGRRNYWVMLVLLSFGNVATYAQLKGDHILGDVGLNAGTQPPPSLTVFVPLYGYDASRLADSNGDIINRHPDMNAYIVGLGGIIVTNLKIAHANYSASILLAWAADRIEGNAIQDKSSLAFSDIYVQPVELGWHAPRADYIVGYGLYIPTGKYEWNGEGNSGLGMWGHELSAGGTWFFDDNKSLSFSTVAFYETHSKKRGTEVRVGDLVTLEGGINKTFYKKISGATTPMPISAGVVYYMQWKVTDDQIPIANTVFTGTKDHLYAMGLEINALHPKTFTSLSLRWLGEFGAKNRFEGNTFFITIAQALASFEKSEK